jgi:serine/threonine protein kinase
MGRMIAFRPRHTFSYQSCSISVILGVGFYTRASYRSSQDHMNQNIYSNRNTDSETMATTLQPSKNDMITSLEQQSRRSIDPLTYQKASSYAIRVYDEMSRRSKLLKAQPLRNRSAEIAQFDFDEVLPHLGELLGKGGFNCVYELECIQLKKECPKTQKQRLQMAALKNANFAIKFLSDEAYETPENACNGSADLFMEAKYLAALTTHHPHPGIIQLHGISSAGPSGLGLPHRGGFFIIIDRLYDTLDRRIDVWKELQQRKLDSTKNATVPLKDEEIAALRKYLTVLFLQRLIVALQIVSAIRHLHKTNVVFRDLKPENVGFDAEGRVKIFDFGLAKELDPKQRCRNGMYTMSGGTGSRRFMAPEVALSKPYGTSVDLYSFGILLWEMLSLEKAFGGVTVEEHRERVLHGGERPKLAVEWTDALQRILQGCWARDPFQRPSAGTVHQQLRNEIQEMISQEFPMQNSLGLIDL